MSESYGLIIFLVLAGLLAAVGSRDLVGFFRIGPGKSKRYRVWLVVLVWVGSFAATFRFWGKSSPKVFTEPTFWTIVLGFTLGLLVLISLLGSLRRHGPGRMYALAWTTFREAMSQRAWLAVPLWLVGVLVVGLFISPYRLIQDRMMLTTELLVGGQLLVVGVLLLTLGCRSIPHELARKTIMVTASKPINMLELVAGKFLGFVLTGALLTGAMSVLSYGILWYHGQDIRRQARLELAAQEDQYRRQERELPPDTDLKEIVAGGVLYARDPIYPTRHASFNGKFDPNIDWRPCLKGGSEAKVQWRFDEIVVAEVAPALSLNFVVERVPEEISDESDFDPDEPLKVELTGISSRFPREFNVRKTLQMTQRTVKRMGPEERELFGVGALFSLNPAEWYQLYNVGPVVLDIRFPVEGHYLYFEPRSVMLGTASEDQTDLVWSAPSEDGKAVVVAHKFRNAYEISGVELGDPEVTYWHFNNVDLSRFAADDEVRFEIQSYREKSDVVKSYTVGLVRAMSIKPDGSREFWPGIGQATLSSENSQEQGDPGEVKLLERDWPGWKEIVIQERRPSSFGLPVRLFSQDADVYVFLACGSSKGWIALGEKSGYLARGRRSFALNVLRCETIIFLQVTVIAAMAVMSSSFLSWPVACFFSLVIYLMGSAQSFLQDVIRFHGTASERMTGLAVAVAAKVLPSFESYKATEFIAEGEIIPLEKLAGLFNHTSLFVVGFMILAYLFLRSRELAK